MANIIERAELFARSSHRNDEYDGQPYDYHLRETWKVAVRFNLSQDVEVICWLHDTLEHEKTTGVTFGMLAENFGLPIAESVYAITDEQGRNRKERKAKTYPKIAADILGAQAKLCDRIANVEYSIKQANKPNLKMYVGEDEDFSYCMKEATLGYSTIFRHYRGLIEQAKSML